MSNYPSLTELGSSPFGIEYDPSAGDHDLETDGGGRPCRWLVVQDGAGTIDVVCADGRALSLKAMAAGHTWVLAVKTIKGTSTETSVVAFW